VLADDSVFCWGRNSSGNDYDKTSSPRGQLGVSPEGGVDALVSTPRKMDGLPSGDPVRGITGGYEHTCAWTRSGAIYCWGGNRHAQLGLGKYGVTADTNPHPAPQKVLF
jgi:alpha-tubulin suppressor-like RCC1 family protein